MTSIVPTATVALDQHVETALINDALRSEADGTLSVEQAMLLDLFDAPEVDYLADDEGGIYVETEDPYGWDHYDEYPF